MKTSLDIETDLNSAFLQDHLGFTVPVTIRMTDWPQPDWEHPDFFESWSKIVQQKLLPDHLGISRRPNHQFFT